MLMFLMLIILSYSTANIYPINRQRVIDLPSTFKSSINKQPKRSAIVLSNDNNVLIAGFDSNFRFITHNKECKYPNTCYDIMTQFTNDSNIVFMGLMPMHPGPECDIPDKSDDDMYMVFGVDPDFKYINNSIYVSDGLWNTLSFICKINSNPKTAWIMVTHIDTAPYIVIN